MLGPALTNCHNRQLHVLLDGDVLVLVREEKGALHGAAIGPCVIEGDVVNENSPDLDITRSHGSMPLETTLKVLMQNRRHWVLIVENLQEGR